MSYVKLFNNTMDEFFKELIDIFPEEIKLQINYNLFQTIIKANAKKPCISFMNGSINYLEQIASRDDAFFKSSNKPDILNSINIEKLWTDDLSPITKNAIWKYIQTFFAIGVNIVEMPPHTHEIIHYIINCNQL